MNEVENIAKTEYRKVRVRYGKLDMARFISQLDMYKLFLSAFRRAKIPARYTAGFNPQLYLSFIFPLPTGVEGVSEYFDFACKVDTLSDAQICENLSASLPRGFAVYEAYAPVRSDKDVDTALYDVGTCSRMTEKWNEFLSQPSVIITKRGKQNGVKTDIEVEIIPHARMRGNFLQLPAGVAFSLNPALVCAAFEKFSGETVTLIRRTALLLGDGEQFS